MKLRHVYLLVLIVGIVLPYWQITPWFLKNGLDIPLFFSELFSNRVSGSFGLDVFVSLVVLLIFAWTETARLQMRRGSLVFAATIFATLGAGVCCGFPLFLYLRQRHIDEA